MNRRSFFRTIALAANQQYRTAITTTFAGMVLRDQVRQARDTAKRYEQAHDGWRAAVGLPPGKRLGTGRVAFEVPTDGLGGEMTVVVVPRTT